MDNLRHIWSIPFVSHFRRSWATSCHGQRWSDAESGGSGHGLEATWLLVGRTNGYKWTWNDVDGYDSNMNSMALQDLKSL